MSLVLRQGLVAVQAAWGRDFGHALGLVRSGAHLLSSLCGPLLLDLQAAAQDGGRRFPGSKSRRSLLDALHFEAKALPRVVLLTGAFLFTYVGLEVAFGGYVDAFGVEELRVSKVGRGLQ